MKNVIALNEHIADIYIYDKQRNRIISASKTLDADEFYEYEHSNSQHSKDEWLKCLSGNKNKSSMLTSFSYNGSENGYLAYIQYIPFSINQEKSHTIVVLIDSDKLISNLSNMPLDEQFVIVDKDNDTCISLGASILNQKEVKDFAFSENNKVIKNNVEYRVHALKSDVASLRYMVVSNVKVQDGSLKTFRIIEFVIFLFCLMIGIFILVYFIKKTYTPIDNLFSEIGGIERFKDNQQSKNGVVNEIAILNKRYREIENSIVKKSGEISKNKLRIFMEQETADVQLIEKNLKAQGIQERNIYVSLFHLEKLTEYSIDFTLIHFALSNVLEELYQKRNIRAICITTSYNTMCVIAENPLGIVNQNTFNEMLTVIRKIFKDNFDLNLSVSVSNVHNIFGLHDCYREALYAMDYRFVKGLGCTVFYLDVEHTNDECEYDIEEEHILINAIKNHKYEECEVALKSIFDKNVYSANYSVIAVHGYVYYLVMLLIRYLPELHVLNINGLMSSFAKNIENELLSILRYHCDAMENSISTRILNYIDEHYMEPDLSVNTFGEIFKLAPSYVSKQFKEQTGQSLLNSIHKTRIEHAKALILEGKTVEYVSQAVGYLNPSSFTRIFKKYEGVSPTAFRTENCIK